MLDIDEYSVIREQIKRHLVDYIHEHYADDVSTIGKDIQFKCLSHSPDNHPSMFIGHNVPHIATCRVCSSSLNIFHVHNKKEGAPLYGRSFVEDNLNKLAVKYGYEPIEMSALTEDQVHKMSLYDIHEATSDILKVGTGIVTRKFCDDLGLSKKICDEMGIGTVTDYNKLIVQLMKTGGWSLEELKSAGILTSRFGAHMLTYSIQDRRGKCIAFAARDWKYDGRFGVTKEEFALDKSGNVRKDKQGKSIYRSKWSNSFTSIIYEKINTLYGFHRAKKYILDSTVYVVEGYADAAILWSFGIQNVVCVGSTAFSPKHVNMLKEADKTIIIICLDNDEAGLSATDRILEEGFKNIPMVKARVLGVPPTLREDGNMDVDPDTYIKAHGKEAFLALPSLSAFEYTISRIPSSFENDEEKDIFVKRFIPIIVNETSAITQEHMRNVIAKKVEVSESLIREYQSNMERVTDLERRERLKKEHFLFKRNFEDALNFDPEKTIALVSEFKDTVTNSMKADYLVKMGTQEVIDGFQAWVEERESSDMADLFWRTGWNSWDYTIGGLQKSDTFILVTGQSNHGKSLLTLNLCVNLLKFNDLSKIAVMYWTIDDTKETLYCKLAAIMSGVDIFKVYAYKSQSEETQKKIKKSFSAINKHIRNQNLIVKGNGIGTGSEDLNKWVELVQKKNPDKQVVLIIDSFSNMSGAGEELQAQIKNINAIHELRCGSNLSVISTFEMNKEGFDNRGSLKNISGSAKITYRVTRTIKIYNDHKACSLEGNHHPENYWIDDRKAKRPILEACLGKTKGMSMSTVAGNLYFQLDETKGLMSEIGDETKFKEFQIANNKQNKFTDVGIAGWKACDTVVDMVSLSPEDTISEQPLLTTSDPKQTTEHPKISSASMIDPSLSHMDDDSL